MITYHPFSFPSHIKAYFIEKIPINLLCSGIESVVLTLDFIENVQQNGIKAPITAQLENSIATITLGNKRYAAAKMLNIRYICAIICAPAIEFEQECWKSLLSIELKNSDDVIKVFGGESNIDVRHLCIDIDNRLVCVAKDHKKWITTPSGAIPEMWIQRKE